MTIRPRTAADASVGQEVREIRLGQLLRGHRKRIGLTQQELADLSTISVRAIRDLEQDRVRKPRTETVRLIADGLRLGPRARRDLEAASGTTRFGGLNGPGPEASELTPPASLQAIWGRDHEVETLCRELLSTAERLVHIVGLSGVGKTRVALEAAGRLHRERRMPVLWCSPGNDTTDYLLTVGQPMKNRLRSWVGQLYGRVPEPSPADGDTLEELIGDSAALLVIDGAPDAPPRWDLVSRLLHDCPGLRLLITSEQHWGMSGERVFLVAPLELPDKGGPSDRGDRAGTAPAAVRIFLEQAREVQPGIGQGPGELAQVAEICRLLDGLPRALRSAASWLILHDVASLHAHLRADPTPFLEHLAEHGLPVARADVLRSRVRRLPAVQQELLAALCDAPDGEFTVEDVLRLTGRTPTEGGRLLRELLLAGVIRPMRRPSGPGFQVLSLIRAVRSATCR